VRGLATGLATCKPGIFLIGFPDPLIGFSVFDRAFGFLRRGVQSCTPHLAL
jgi:hypothetical protein